MKKAFQTILLTCVTIAVYPQLKNEKLKSIGVSIPIIWNNSEATYYALGSKKTPNGKAVSYGININHSRTVYKNLYVIVGVGYFKQAFGIRRPFDYTPPDGTKPLVSTKNYSYSSLHLLLGIGYNKKITTQSSLSGKIVYNVNYSFRQKYNQNYFPKDPKVTKKLFCPGNMITATLGIERRVSSKISIGLDVLAPLLTSWNDDDTFFYLGWGTDEQKIARNRFSIGSVVTCKYNF